MKGEIGLIGQRLKGMRESLDISAQEVASLCNIPVEHYLRIESGEADPSVYRLEKISKHYGISLEALLYGEEPQMDSYFLTRKGHGLAIERFDSYKCQSLAAGFKGRKVDPFLVTVEPLPDGKSYNKNVHEGQEFDIVIEGTLEIVLEDKPLKLEAGDSIYFDARQKHCMRALGEKPVKFLCVVI